MCVNHFLLTVSLDTLNKKAFSFKYLHHGTWGQREMRSWEYKPKYENTNSHKCVGEESSD